MGEASKDCPQCKSDCQLTTYSTTVTSSEFRFFNPRILSFKQILSRLCDSRNLNLTPFCKLATSSLAKWQPAIKSTYGNTSTDYTSKLPGPWRLKYPSNPEKELLVSLTQVLIRNACFIMNDPIQGEDYYNAYEKDIAVVNIFFGGSTVFGEETS